MKSDISMAKNMASFKSLTRLSFEV